MPTGRVKIFHEKPSYGFVVNDEDGQDLYVTGDQIEGGTLRSGDEVEFEIVETDNGDKEARTVKVTKQAPEDNPVGRTMKPPPTWDQLEERERQRRQQRRRRR